LQCATCGKPSSEIAVPFFGCSSWHYAGAALASQNGAAGNSSGMDPLGTADWLVRESVA
jgi:hypothetical protein